eukprot:1185739-Prorocentrum_minimum.AAC.1
MPAYPTRTAGVQNSQLNSSTGEVDSTPSLESRSFAFSPLHYAESARTSHRRRPCRCVPEFPQNERSTTLNVLAERSVEGSASVLAELRGSGAYRGGSI